jgi:hypothetical protein
MRFEMILTIQEKILSLLAFLLFLLAFFLWGWHVGGKHIQAKWDLANAKESAVVMAQIEAARTHELQQATSFAQTESNYLEATTHANPNLAPSIPAAIGNGTLQLRNACPASHPGTVSEATAASRAADAAATQSLADRTAAAVRIVSIGDAADAREHQLDAQIIGLQELLVTERK